MSTLLSKAVGNRSPFLRSALMKEQAGLSKP